MEWQLTVREQFSFGNRNRFVSPQGVYPSSEPDEWVALSVRSEAEWAALCEVLGRADWQADARLGTMDGRQAAADEIDAGIATWTRERPAATAVQALQAGGIAGRAGGRPQDCK